VQWFIIKFKFNTSIIVYSNLYSMTRYALNLLNITDQVPEVFFRRKILRAKHFVCSILYFSDFIKPFFSRRFLKVCNIYILYWPYLQETILLYHLYQCTFLKPILQWAYSNPTKRDTRFLKITYPQGPW